MCRSAGPPCLSSQVRAFGCHELAMCTCGCAYTAVVGEQLTWKNFGVHGCETIGKS